MWEYLHPTSRTRERSKQFMSKALANQGAGMKYLAVRGIDACASSLLDGIGGHDL